MMRYQRTRHLIGMLTLAALMLVATPPARAQSEPHLTRLHNRLTVITKEVTSSHVVAICVLLRGGSSLNPEGTPGLAEFTQRMLLRGTSTRNADQITGPIEAIGGSLQARADFDYSQLLLLSSADALDIGMDVLADVLRNPRFDPADIDRERQQLLAELARTQDNPEWQMQRSLSQMLYASGPYRDPIPGTPESVKKITRDDLLKFHERYYTPENMIVVVAGNVDRATAEEKVQRAFGDMRYSGLPTVTPRPSVPKLILESNPSVLVSEGDTELANVIVGFPMEGISRAEYPAILVMNSLLGGGMGSRLARELREHQGFGYDLGSYYSDLAGPGYLAAYVKTDPIRTVFGLDGPYQSSEMMLNKAKDSLLDQFDWVRQHPITDSELERARRYTIGSFIYEHQRTLNQARFLGWFEFVGLGYRYDDELPREIEKVTKDDLLTLAKKYFNRYAIALVVPEPK